MLRIITRRLLLSIPLLFVVSAITFVLAYFVPGDPAVTLLGANATGEQYEALRQALHLDLPLYQQYFNYMHGVLTGDLGRSIFTNQPVSDLIAARLPVTEVLGVRAGPRLLEWQAEHGDLVTAQLASEPEQWTDALRSMVTSVTADDFVVGPVDGDALDLVVLARRG